MFDWNIVGRFVISGGEPPSDALKAHIEYLKQGRGALGLTGSKATFDLDRASPSACPAKGLQAYSA